MIRIVTPGTVSDEALLQERQDNLLAAVWQDARGFGYATLDITSGRFRILQLDDKDAMAAELQRTRPQSCSLPGRYMAGFRHYSESGAAPPSVVGI